MNLRALVACVPALALLASCGESAPSVRSIALSSTITPPAGIHAGGTVHVTVFHAWELEGELRHPRGEIESFETNFGAFVHTLTYPEGAGEGLLVYAWLDTNGDGVHCTPTVRDEPAGLVEVSDFPAERVVANVELTQPCRGPDWFYPARKPG